MAIFQFSSQFDFAPYGDWLSSPCPPFFLSGRIFYTCTLSVNTERALVKLTVGMTIGSYLT